MAERLRDIRVLGVHQVVPTAEEIAEAVEIQWGDGLSGAALAEAERAVREHFAGLRLIEVQVEPPAAEVDWLEVTQPIAGVDRSDWQAPYDEQPVDEEGGRWAFFLHEVLFDAELSTPVGPRKLPAVTAIPTHLAGIRYEVP